MEIKGCGRRMVIEPVQEKNWMRKAREGGIWKLFPTGGSDVGRRLICGQPCDAGGVCCLMLLCPACQVVWGFRW